MSKMAFQITSLTIVYSIVYSVLDQRKHQSSASLAFVQGIHRWIPCTKGQWRKIFPFDDVIMIWANVDPGGRLNKKDGLTKYGDSHVKDKTS